MADISELWRTRRDETKEGLRGEQQLCEQLERRLQLVEGAEPEEA